MLRFKYVQFGTILCLQMCTSLLEQGHIELSSYVNPIIIGGHGVRCYIVFRHRGPLWRCSMTVTRRFNGWQTTSKATAVIQPTSSLLGSLLAPIFHRCACLPRCSMLHFLSGSRPDTHDRSCCATSHDVQTADAEDAPFAYLVPCSKPARWLHFELMASRRLGFMSRLLPAGSESGTDPGGHLRPDLWVLPRLKPPAA